MQKPKRFQTISITEALKKAVEVGGTPLQKLARNQEAVVVVPVKAVAETVSALQQQGESRLDNKQ